MSFLYRSALTIVHRDPFLRWVRSLDSESAALPDEALKERTVYLVPEFDRKPKLSSVLDACWDDIFVEELAVWHEDEQRWPAKRTRQMFDEWFEAELTMTVYDLVPEEPLTQTDVDTADVYDATTYCAWCAAELDPEKGRWIAFTLPDRQRFAHRQGRVVPLSLGADRVVSGIMTLDSSEEARRGEDLLVRACTSRCEKLIRKTVPKALKRLSRA